MDQEEQFIILLKRKQVYPDKNSTDLSSIAE